MTVITKLRRQWFHKQGRFPPEDVEAVLKMRHTFGQRDGETEADWRTRLQRLRIPGKVTACSCAW